MQKVSAYIETWERRCYVDGIPDEVHPKLAASGRVPSYRQIALAILRNDMNLHSIGFAQRSSALIDELIRKRSTDDAQLAFWPSH